MISRGNVELELKRVAYNACVALNNQENRGINPLSGEIKSALVPRHQFFENPSSSQLTID